MERSFHRAQMLRWTVALLTFGAAVTALLYGPSRLEYPAPLLVIHASAVADTIILATTFYVSIGLIIGRRAAWRMGVIVLSTAVVWESLEAREPISHLSIAPFIGLIGLIATRRYYPIASHPSVIVRTLRRALIFTLFSTAVGCFAFFILARAEHHPFSLGFNIVRALDTMYSLQDVFTPIRHPTVAHVIGRVFLLVLGITNYTVVAFALLRPVADTFQWTPIAHARALYLLRRLGNSSEDYFKYFPADKSYYFGRDVEGFVAYGLHEGTCVALADPIAASYRARRVLLDEFLSFTASHGWQTVFLGVEEEVLPLYEHPELRQLKIGESARVPLAHLPDLLRRKNNRNIMNRFTRLGFTATMHAPHHTTRLITELRAVSDAWLGSDRSERAFAMGAFDPAYLQQSRLMVVRDRSNRAVAFVNLQPNFSRNQQRASIDLMRAVPDAPTNTMDFLFLNLMQQMRQEGWREFDLGLAPLSGLQRGRISERGLHLLYAYTDRWLSFRGLRRFKDKFNPTWTPISIAYTGAPSRLAAISVAINKLMQDN